MTESGMQPGRNKLLLSLRPLVSLKAMPYWFISICLAQFLIVFVWDGWNSRRERDRLLHHTDHHALLKACRDLMRDHPETEMSDPDHDPRIPDIIRGLGVSYVAVNRDHVHIKLHGGFDHYGVDAFAEGIDPGKRQMLIDGL